MTTKQTTKRGTKKGTAKATAKKSSAKKSSAKKGAAKRGAQAARFKLGERVSWESSGGTSHGQVAKIATTNGNIKDFEYKATKDDPRYIVETDEGKHAAHKAEELRRT